MIGSGISGRYSAKIGLDKMMLSGALVTLVFMSFTLVTAWLDIAHPLGFFAFTFSIGLGNGLVMPSANAGMLDVKPELAGSAAGLGGSMMTFGGAALSALSGFLLTVTSGAWPLIWCIIGSSFLCLVAALYTNAIEKQVRDKKKA